jgi:hypothetical protein
MADLVPQGDIIQNTYDDSKKAYRVEETEESTLLAGEKIVALAITAEALAASTASSYVIVQAKSTNTGAVAVGNATTQKASLLANESVAIEIDNLNKVYIKVAVNGEGVNYVGAD